MIKLFIYIFLAFFTFDRLTRKYLNPYKLIFIFGKKGSGKTTTLTKLALQHYKKGWKVYSTVDIPNAIKISPDLVGLQNFPEKSLIVIDEVGMIWDNRDFKNFKSHVRDYFKFQRQYKHKVILFSQTFDVDLKLRNLTDEMYLLTNFMRVFSLQRRIVKKIGIKECADGTSTLADTYSFDWLGLSFTFIPRWANYFQSFDPKFIPLYTYDTKLPITKLQEKYLNGYRYYFGLILHLFKLVYLYLKERFFSACGHVARTKKKLYDKISTKTDN